MHAAAIVAIVCCLFASVRAQEVPEGVDVLSLVRQQLNGPAVQNIVNRVPEANGCRSNALAFIRSCTEDLIGTTSLKDDSATIIGLVSYDQASETLRIKGSALAGYIPGATASDACCAAACEVAKAGCMCQPDAWAKMQETFNLDSGSGVQDVFNGVVGKCAGGSRSFQAVMPGQSPDKCSTDFIPTAKAFVC